MLKIKDLCVEADEKKILNNVSLEIKKGTFHVLLGPNGSGKTTLAKTIMGLDHHKLKKGQIIFGQEDITKLKPEERAKLGIALTFQHPPAIKGVKLSEFLNRISKTDAYKKYLTTDLLERQVNVGFSGGELKHSELAQVFATEPKFIIFDEVDSGIDMKRLETITKMIKEWISPDNSALVITHNPRVIELLKPDIIDILLDGKITCSTNNWNEIYCTITKYGYEKCKECKLSAD